jgi:hypothetical protein
VNITSPSRKIFKVFLVKTVEQFFNLHVKRTRTDLFNWLKVFGIGFGRGSFFNLSFLLVLFYHRSLPFGWANQIANFYE